MGERADQAEDQLNPVPGWGLVGLVEAGDGLLPQPGGLMVGEALLAWPAASRQYRAALIGSVPASAKW